METVVRSPIISPFNTSDLPPIMESPRTFNSEVAAIEEENYAEEQILPETPLEPIMDPSSPPRTSFNFTALASLKSEGSLSPEPYDDDFIPGDLFRKISSRSGISEFSGSESSFSIAMEGNFDDSDDECGHGKVKLSLRAISPRSEYSFKSVLTDVNAGQVTKIWFDLPAEMKGDVISCLVEHVHCEKREIINALMQRFEFGLLDASRIYNWSKLLNEDDEGNPDALTEILPTPKVWSIDMIDNDFMCEIHYYTPTEVHEFIEEMLSTEELAFEIKILSILFDFLIDESLQVKIDSLKNKIPHLKEENQALSFLSVQNKIHTSEMAILGKILKRQKNRKRLLLSDNEIDPAAVRPFIEILSMTNISTLWIDRNKLGIDGAALFSRYLPYCNLTQLSLNKNWIGDEGISLIATILKETKLRELLLMDNNISDEGCEALAEGLIDTSILDLDLSFNSISSTGSIAIANVLQQTQLRKLYLNDNYIEDVGCEALITEFSSEKNNLAVLELWDNNISEELISNIKHRSAISRCIFLTRNLEDLRSHNVTRMKSSTPPVVTNQYTSRRIRL